LQDSKQEFKEENLSNAVIEAINNMTYSIDQIKNNVDNLSPGVFSKNPNASDDYSIIDVGLSMKSINQTHEEEYIKINQKIRRYKQDLYEINNLIQYLENKKMGSNVALSIEETDKYNRLIQEKNLIQNQLVKLSRLNTLNKFDM
jgi:transcriptional regulator NrdR family protein